MIHLTSKNKLTLVSLLILLASILYKNEFLKSFFYTLPTNKENVIINGVKIFSTDELAPYNGLHMEKLYLSVLGTVFDVTKGRKHYEHGGSYHYFIGKDGSRALITGNFKDESDIKDHVIDLQCNDIFALFHWKNTFKEKYMEIGVLNGRYFDENGKPTPYSKELDAKVYKCKIEKQIAKKKEIENPPCNIAWSADEGTKVWCTKTSGGITRNWAGVPRQLYTPGEEKPLCVCINPDKKASDALVKEYDGCPSSSTSCVVNSS